MKQFIVLSDTHGELTEAEEILRSWPGIRSVIHLGDYSRDALQLKEAFPEHEFFIISGNCDFFLSEAPMERLLEVEGKKLLLTHGHRYDVKNGTGRLEARGKAEGLDVILYGHTHIPLLLKTSAGLILNPGSTSSPRGGHHGTYALLEIGNGRVEARLLEV